MTYMQLLVLLSARPFQSDWPELMLANVTWDSLPVLAPPLFVTGPGS